MNQKNSLNLNICFIDEDNPINLFREWFNDAKKSEINDPNAVALGTVDYKGYPSVRMVLLKDYNDDGFVFYTNFNSDKSKAIKKDPKISMCFHWKSLLRQVRIVGLASKVSDKEWKNPIENQYLSLEDEKLLNFGEEFFLTIIVNNYYLLFCDELLSYFEY